MVIYKIDVGKGDEEWGKKENYSVFELLFLNE